MLSMRRTHFNLYSFMRGTKFTLYLVCTKLTNCVYLILSKTLRMSIFVKIDNKKHKTLIGNFLVFNPANYFEKS